MNPDYWKDHFEALYKEVLEARRNNKHERTVCPHGIVQYDKNGEVLPCAWPNCPAGFRGCHLYRHVRGPMLSYAAMQKEPSPSVAVEHVVYDRLYVAGVADYAPRLYLWVTQAQKEQETALLRKEREEAMAESYRAQDARRERWAKLPLWKRGIYRASHWLRNALHKLEYKLPYGPLP